MALDEDACAICEGDRSTTKNPIMFCDGKGCNVPVHKDCYGVDDIPDGEWYCQRCEAKRNGKPSRIVCCPQQTGAFKTTVKPGNFIHIACAKWNLDINHEAEPYDVDKVRMDQYKCFQCEKTKGICIKCQHADCEKWVHCTCAINTGLISVSKKVPENYSPRCNEHQAEELVNKRLIRRYGDTSMPTRNTPKRKRRLLKRNLMESSEDDQVQSESEEEEEEAQDEEEDEEDQDHEEEEEEDDEEEEEDEEESDDMGTTTRKKKPKTKKSSSDNNTPIKKRRATAPHSRKGGPIRLFMSDQSESDDDDRMGRKSKSKSPKINTSKNINNSSHGNGSNNINNNSSTMSLASPSSTATTKPPRGMLDLLEAKRKKSQKLSLQPPLHNNNNNNNHSSSASSSSSSQTSTPTTANGPTPASLSTALPTPTAALAPSSSPAQIPASSFGAPPPVTTPTSATPAQPSLLPHQNKPTPNPLPHKQKLPNKAHLMPNQPPSNGIKKQSPVFQDLDEIQNNMLGQRRATSSAIATTTSISTPLNVPNLAANNSNIPSSPFDTPMNGERRNTMPDRKPSLFQQSLAPPPPPQQQQHQQQQQQQQQQNQQQPRRSLDGPNDVNEFQKSYIKSKISEIMDEVLFQPPQRSPHNEAEILRQEVMRLKEENRRLQTFKKSVAEVFEGLNVKVPSGLPISVDRMEDYVNELRMMFVRNGSIHEQDHARISQCVEDMIIDRL